MRNEPSQTPPTPPAWLNWRLALAALLGATGNMGYNLLSNDLGYRGVAILFALGAVAVAALWLRSRPDLPGPALLKRVTRRVVLSIAALAALTTAVAPAEWTGYGTLTVAGLVTLGILISEVSTGLRVLLGAGFMGFGLDIVIAGTQTASEQLLVGVLFGVFGILAIGLGVIFSLGATELTSSRHNAHQSNEDKPSPVSDREVHLSLRQPLALSILMFGVGLLLITAGVLSERKGSDSTLIFIGLVFAGMGVEGFTKRGIVRSLAFIFIGLSTVAFGVAYVVSRSFLPGAAQIGIGLAIIGVANSWLINGGQWRSLGRRWAYLAGASSDTATTKTSSDSRPPEKLPDDPERDT